MTWMASSHSQHDEQFSRKGEGIVETSLSSHSITFNEKGAWKTIGDVEVNYSNAYRWTWNWREEMIALEHLRHGKKHPAFLFYLKPSSNNLLESAQPHICGDDAYFGWLQQHHLFLQLQIRTLGPCKNERIETIYT